MNKTLIAGLLLAGIASFNVHAQDAATDKSGASGDTGGWSGSGEFGFAAATGNTRSQNLDAKFALKQDNDQWKNAFYLGLLRTKAQQKTVDASGNTIEQYNTTANRYDGGASVGLKLDTRSYIVSAARYDHDEFGANLWQAAISLGYGYIALKDDRNELSFEIGPGYKRYRPAQVQTQPLQPPQPVQGEVVGRGLINYTFKISTNTAFENTFLIEAGSKNTYLQNDAGLAVSVTKKLALKVGFQVRYNSSVQPGIDKTDTVTTTNLVYNF